jgi:hypothetical protein
MNFALLNGYSGAFKQNAEIIGLAKDGHLIFGPWNQSGALWGCNAHNVCNGVFLADGAYAYVGASTFPYVIGCWGPSTGQNFQ